MLLPIISINVVQIYRFFAGHKAFQLMLVINTPASRACCSNQQLSGCAAWLITVAKVQSWFFFATPSICLSSHLLLSRSWLPDCALSYSPSAHWGRRRDLNWISPVCLFPVQFNSTNFAISRAAATATAATASVCPAICQVFVHSQQQADEKRGEGRGGAGGGEIQLQSFMGHSWVTGCGCNVVAAVACLTVLGVLGRFSSLGVWEVFTANSYASDKAAFNSLPAFR